MGPGFDALKIIEAAIVKNARSRLITWAAFGVPGGALGVAWWLNESQKYGYGAMPFAVVGIVGVVLLGVAANAIIAANAERKAPRENPLLRDLAGGTVQMVSVDVGNIPSVSVITRDEKWVSVNLERGLAEPLIEILRPSYPDLKLTKIIVIRR